MINRNITSNSISGGEVLSIKNSKNVYIKNGCITGGGALNNGGGIWVYGSSVNCYLTDMVITGNVAGANGGGVYTSDNIEKITLDNTIIEGNYANGYGGGIYCDYSAPDLSYGVLDLTNVVKIQNNIGSDDRNNLTFYACTGDMYADCADVNLTDGSVIYVTFSRIDDISRFVSTYYTYNHDNDKYFHSESDKWELTNGTYSFGYLIVERLCLREKKSGC